MNTIEKLKRIAREATQGKWRPSLANETYIAKGDRFVIISRTYNGLNMSKDRDHITAFNPQTILTLLELLDFYKSLPLMSYGTSTALEKESALMAKLEECVK